MSAMFEPDEIALAYAHGDTATLSYSIISGEPWHTATVRVIAVDGDTLYYTRDGIWYSAADRSRPHTKWALDAPATVIDDETGNRVAGDQITGGFASEEEAIMSHGSGNDYPLADIVASALKVSYGAAVDMCNDDSGSTYSRVIYDTVVTFNPLTRQLNFDRITTGK